MGVCIYALSTHPRLLKIYGASSHKATVLVVKDHEKDRGWMVHVLKKAGYLVKAAATGIQAVDLCRFHSFGVITFDLSLPDARGSDVLMQIRELHLNEEVPL